MGGGPGYRIVVVEDHPIFRDGLIQCLDAEPDFRVVGHWGTGAVDPVAVGRLAPDVVLMDIELPEQSGIEATRLLRAHLPALRVVMLTAFAEADLLFDAVQAGAVGYLLKHTPASELGPTLRRILDGEHVLTPSLAARFLREFQARESPTRRQKLPQLSLPTVATQPARMILNPPSLDRRPARCGDWLCSR